MDRDLKGFSTGAIVGFFFLSILIPLVAIIIGIIGLIRGKKNSGWVLAAGIVPIPFMLPIYFAQVSALAPFIYAIF